MELTKLQEEADEKDSAEVGTEATQDARARTKSSWAQQQRPPWASQLRGIVCPRGSRPSLEAQAVQLLPVASAELRSYSFSPSSRDEGHSPACQGRGCHPHQPLGKNKQRTGFNNPPMVSLASENGLQAKREAQILGHSPSTPTPVQRKEQALGTKRGHHIRCPATTKQHGTQTKKGSVHQDVELRYTQGHST